MLRELRRPTAIPDYVEKDEGRQSRAFYEHGHIEGSRRYHEQVVFLNVIFLQTV